MSEYDIRQAISTLQQLASTPQRYGLDDNEVAVLNASTATLTSLVTPYPDPPITETINLVPGADGTWSVAA
jgi:hypothetical protein